MKNSQSKVWDTVASTIDFQAPVDFKAIQKYLKHNSRILDFGCGYGRISKLLIKNGYNNVVGYETSQEMVNRAKKEVPNCEFNYYNGKTIPETDSTFDAIICSAVFTCIPEINQKKKWIQELYRKLKPNGYIIITEFSCPETVDAPKFVSSVGVTMKFIRKSEIQKLFQKFKEVSCKVVDAVTLTGKSAMCVQFIGRKQIKKSANKRVS
jgi:ubiquinone/menaquinone biosynthesis C-methylase UbiE